MKHLNIENPGRELEQLPLSEDVLQKMPQEDEVKTTTTLQTGDRYRSF